MIKTLRKRHLQIWALWALLIPAGIVVAWMAVPEKEIQELLQPEPVSILPNVVSGYGKKLGDFSAQLRTNNDSSQYQLEWKQFYSLKRPSILIYHVSGQQHELLGRIGTKGSYYFNLPNDSLEYYSFISYDAVMKQRIDSINIRK